MMLISYNNNYSNTNTNNSSLNWFFLDQQRAALFSLIRRRRKSRRMRKGGIEKRKRIKVRSNDNCRDIFCQMIHWSSSFSLSFSFHHWRLWYNSLTIYCHLVVKERKPVPWSRLFLQAKPEVPLIVAGTGVLVCSPTIMSPFARTFKE